MIKDVCHIRVCDGEGACFGCQVWGGLRMYNEEGKQNERQPCRVTAVGVQKSSAGGVYIMHLAEGPVCVQSDDRNAGIDYYLVPAPRLRCCV